MRAQRWGEMLPGTPYGRAALGRRDATRNRQRARFGSLQKLVEKHLTQNQMFGSWQTAGRSLRPRSRLSYISWYINDYGRPWTSSDPNPKKGPTTDQYARSGGCCFRLRIRWLADKASPVSVTLFNTKFCPHGFAQTPTGRPRLIFQPRERVSIDLSRGIHKFP